MELLLAFITLTAMEIILGIDNIIFIAILTSRVPGEEQKEARRVGLLAAMGMRIVLLLSLSFIAHFTRPVLWMGNHGFSGRDLIMLIGGLFLIAKAVSEIHEKIEGQEDHESGASQSTITMKAAIMQILLIDIVFSLDSVITAIGMTNNLMVMIAAVVASVLVMMRFAESVTSFIERHPTVKMLALSFLVLIGVMLTFEGFGGHMEKGYIYFAMGFSVVVEMLNIRLRKGRKITASPAHPEGRTD